MKQSAVTFKSEGLELEGIIGYPNQEGKATPGVVICHPHPLMGGNMENMVVVAVYSALVQQGLIALRFNFRGVGNSEGTYSKGEKEPGDVKGAINVLKSLPAVDGRRIGLAGYSFGAGVVMGGISNYSDAKALALISPPSQRLKDSTISKYSRPKLFISGDEDALVPPAELEAYVRSLPQPVQFTLVQGADHYWGEHMQEVASQVAQFFADRLK